MTAVFPVSSLRSGLLRAINYSPAIEAIRRRGASSNATKLGTMLASIGPAYGTVFTRLDCDPAVGIELVSQADMFAAEPAGRVIRRESMRHPERHEIKKWQVLIAGAGTLGETELYGRPLIADDRLTGKYVGPHAMVLTFLEPTHEQSLFAYAFLTTQVGISAVRSASYGTKILGLRKDLIAELPIPSASPDVVSRVAAEVRKAVELRYRYLEQIRVARSAVEALPEMQEALAMCSQRRARCILWRERMPTLTAWNYASAGEALNLLTSKWGARLRDVIQEDGVFNGPRFARVPCRAPHGINFVSQRHVFLVRPVARRIAHPGFGDEKLFVPHDSLLVGGHGTLGEGEIFGRVEYVSGRLAETAFTQDILRVIPQREYAELAYAYLSTTVGFRLLRSTAVGTKILSMRPDLLLALPFPEVDSSLKSRLRGSIKAAMEARDGAVAAESEATRIIEQEVLPAWLD